MRAANETPMTDHRACAVTWCERPVKARGLCKGHHRRLRAGLLLDAPWGTRFGGQSTGRPRTDPEDRILARLNRDLPNRTLDECWEWPGTRTAAGYAVIGVGTHDGRKAQRQYVHRLIARVPDDAEVLHLCDNPPCVNPFHLRWGTHADNMRWMAEQGRGRNQWTVAAR